MGKQPGPSPEELEFIFSCFKRGLSDPEVLDELGDTEFIPRNRRFIHERRRHFDAAKRVLFSDVYTEATSLITNQRQKHFQRLTEMTTALLNKGLDFVRPYPGSSSGVIIGPPELETGIPTEELSIVLDNNFQAACNQFSEYDLSECFIPHFMAEHPDIKTQDFHEFISDKPYQVIEILRVLMRRRTFKGTCPICIGW